MLLKKIQDEVSVLSNLNNGDIMIYSKSEIANDIQITPHNIYWVDYSNQQGVSLKSFGNGEKFILYPELKADHYWYILLLSLYVKR